MKPKNFPRRRLLRVLRAKGLDVDDYRDALIEARGRRSKKQRGKEK